MKKIIIIAAVAIGIVAFVGADVLKDSVGNVRTAVRDALTSEVPLTNQLAEAQAQVDAYAESIIRGEVAAENLENMITGVEREVRALNTRVEHERHALAALRQNLSGSGHGDVVPASLKTVDQREERAALRRVHAFQAASELLARRTQDLERLRQEHATTVQSLTEARSEQIRLGEEVRVLAAELESLAARKAAARTRNAVGDSTVASSGFAEAKERIQSIRSSIREQNKLLQYYEYERVVRTETVPGMTAEMPANALQAIDEALAAYPGN